MRDIPQCTSAAGILLYRAEITDGQQLRDRGLLDESCDVLFLFCADTQGEERQLCWLEMSAQHDDELDELMDELPRDGVIAVLQAMIDRRNSINGMVEVLKAARGNH